MDSTPKRPRRAASFCRNAFQPSPFVSQKGDYEQTPLKLERRTSRQQLEGLGSDVSCKGKENGTFESSCLAVLEGIAELDEEVEEARAPEKPEKKGDDRMEDEPQQQIEQQQQDVVGDNDVASLPLLGAAGSHREVGATLEFEINGGLYRVHDQVVVGDLLAKAACPPLQDPGSVHVRRECKPNRSLAALRTRRAAAKQAEVCASGGVADVIGVSVPGTPPRRMRDATSQETEKLRSPHLRSAFARALSAALAPDAPEPAEEGSVQLQRALRNYEEFHALTRGTAGAEDVANSSAGVFGWAGAGVVGRGNTDARIRTNNVQETAADGYGNSISS